MQPPTANLPHSSLLPRIEATLGGRRYASCLESDVSVENSVSGHSVAVAVHAARYDITYTVGEKSVGIDATIHAGPDARDPVFVLPVISGTCKMETHNASSSREIYWLVGGFKATEYTLRPNANGRVSVTLRP